MDPKFQLAPEVLAAVIGGLAGLVTSTVKSLLDRRRWRAEIDKLAAETAKLRAETEALRRKPLETEREKYHDLLMKFLNPFLDLLKQNERIYDALLEGRGALEYHPKSLARFFASLPYDDRRKLYWFQRIDRLRENNRRILALVQQYGGNIVTSRFRDACAEFRYHADEWEDVWKAVENTRFQVPGEQEVVEGEPIPGEQIVGEGELRPEALYANRFPASLRPALDEEVIEVRRRVEPNFGDAADAPQKGA